MIIKKNEIRVEDIESLRGGIGIVTQYHFLEEEDSCGCGKNFNISVQKPGTSIGYHQHVGNYEVYYILEGKALVCDDGAESMLTPGDCMICKNGHYHSIVSTGPGDLRYLSLILYDQDEKS